MSRASFLGLGGAAAAASGGRARLRLADDADCGCLLLVPALPAARDGASAAAAGLLLSVLCFVLPWFWYCGPSVAYRYLKVKVSTYLQ